MLCLPETTSVRGSESNSWEELESSGGSGTLSSTRLCLNSCSHSGRSCDEFPRTSSLLTFLFGFSVSAGPCDRLPCTSTLLLSLLVGVGWSVGVTVSCNEDVWVVSEDEVEELVDRPEDNERYVVRCVAIDLPAIFDEMWVSGRWSSGNYTSDVRRVFRVKELPVYHREALPSRINPILWHKLLPPFVRTSPLAVTTVRRTFGDPYGFQFGRVKVFPADHMHAFLENPPQTLFPSASLWKQPLAASLSLKDTPFF